MGSRAGALRKFPTTLRHWTDGTAFACQCLDRCRTRRPTATHRRYFVPRLRDSPSYIVGPLSQLRYVVVLVEGNHEDRKNRPRTVRAGYVVIANTGLECDHRRRRQLADHADGSGSAARGNGLARPRSQQRQPDRWPGHRQHLRAAATFLGRDSGAVIGFAGESSTLPTPPAQQINDIQA